MLKAAALFVAFLFFIASDGIFAENLTAKPVVRMVRSNKSQADKNVQPPKNAPLISIDDSIKVQNAQKLSIESNSNVLYDRINHGWKPFFEETTKKGLCEMFPSAIWLEKEQLYLVVSRVRAPTSKSALYATSFDKEWKRVTREFKLGAIKIPGPIPVHEASTEKGPRGPEDPRIFLHDGVCYVIFNMIKPNETRRIFVFSFKDSSTRELTIEGVPDNKLPLKQKNWTPITINNEVHFIYNVCGMEMVKCDLVTAKCTHLKARPSFSPPKMRGGSQYIDVTGMIFKQDTGTGKEERKDRFYASFAYYHYFGRLCHIYRPVVSIVKVHNNDPKTLQSVYFGEPFELNGVLHQKSFVGRQLKENEVCSAGAIVMLLSVVNIDAAKDTCQFILSYDDVAVLKVDAQGFLAYIKTIVDAHVNGKLPFGSLTDSSRWCEKHGDKRKILNKFLQE